MTSDTWRLIDTGYRSGSFNMAADEVLMTQVSSGTSSPILRFYCWRPAAVSLGYFQAVDQVIDLEGCKKRGIEVVRRITGGRAVLHHYELTYSIIAPQQHPAVSGSILESYLKISKCLLNALHSLGIPVQLVPRGVKSGPATSACFDAPSWYELTVDGKKLVGSAQTRRQGTLLQHGSILLNLDVEELADTIRFNDFSAKQRFKKMIRHRACAINQLSQHHFSTEKIATAIVAAAQKAWKVRFRSDALTNAEQTLISGNADRYTV